MSRSGIGRTLGMSITSQGHVRIRTVVATLSGEATRTETFRPGLACGGVARQANCTRLAKQAVCPWRLHEMEPGVLRAVPCEIDFVNTG